MVRATVILAAAMGALAMTAVATDAGPATSQPTVRRLNPELLNLPANTWVRIKPDRNPEGRSFSGVCWGDGLIYYFGGGHHSYVANDMELYDVAANTWTQATEPEDWRDYPNWAHLSAEEKKKVKPIGGGSSPAPFVLSPRGRPLIYHTYQQHVWFPEERAFYNINTWQRAGLWAFDPVKRQWREIARQIPNFGDQSTLALTYDPGLKTVVALTTTKGPAAYAFDREKKSWTKRCDLPKGASGDIYTSYDPWRKVHVVTTRGLWFTLDLAAGTSGPMKHFAEAVAAAGRARPVPDASMLYDPDSRRTLAIANTTGKTQGSPIELWAHDADTDQWSAVKMSGSPPSGDIRWGLMVHDSNHKCCLFVNVRGIQGSRLQGGPVDGLFAFRLSLPQAKDPPGGAASVRERASAKGARHTVRWTPGNGQQ